MNSEEAFCDGAVCCSVPVHDPYVYDAEGEEVGEIGIVGNNCLKYTMRDGNYTLRIDNPTTQPASLLVEYQNDGYYRHVESYDAISPAAFQVELSAFDEQDVTVRAATGARSAQVIQPSHVMDEEELVVRNDW